MGAEGRGRKYIDMVNLTKLRSIVSLEFKKQSVWHDEYN